MPFVLEIRPQMLLSSAPIIAHPSLLIALMMEAVQSSETLVNSYQPTQLCNPEDSHLHTHRRETLKSHNYFFIQHYLTSRENKTSSNDRITNEPTYWTSDVVS
jgi:hypothetical protein